MPVVEANGIRVHYQLGGQGERVLFISGTGGDLRNRPNVFDGPLAKAFEVLAYDQRGLGQTEKPDTEYCMADYADDAAGLLDAVGWDRVRVMGVSFGGMVAQELALRHPDRISALVLACTSSGGEGGASYPLQELEQLEETARIERNLELADTRRDPAWREAHPEKWQATWRDPVPLGVPTEIPSEQRSSWRRGQGTIPGTGCRPWVCRCCSPVAFMTASRRWLTWRRWLPGFPVRSFDSTRVATSS